MATVLRLLRFIIKAKNINEALKGWEFVLILNRWSKLYLVHADASATVIIAIHKNMNRWNNRAPSDKFHVTAVMNLVWKWVRRSAKQKEIFYLLIQMRKVNKTFSLLRWKEMYSVGYFNCFVFLRTLLSFYIPKQGEVKNTFLKQIYLNNWRWTGLLHCLRHKTYFGA